jgi:uncharacterized protein
MLFVISPAKSLDFETPVVGFQATEPLFDPRAAELIRGLRRFDVESLAGLMKLSEPLARLNVERYADWRVGARGRPAKPAVFAFAGDVYGGLDAPSLKPADIAWAQQHALILSGLYGVLRPLDRIQPHRLEMGTALVTKAGSRLVDYWRDEVGAHLRERLAADDGVLVNLASEEYFGVVAPEQIEAKVVHCVFEERDAKAARGWKVVGVHAKRARGLMLRHAIQRRARTPRALRSFNSEGYAFDASSSSAHRLVFRRANAVPAATPRRPSARPATTEA